MKTSHQSKRAFALLITIFLVIVVSLLSYRIMENNIFSSNLNTLKYLHLQAVIHKDSLKEYILTHSKEQILSYSLLDTRFDIEVIHQLKDGKDHYYFSVFTKDETPIRLSEKIIK